MTTILDAARSAYGAGLCPLPTKDDGSKRPDVSEWTPFKTVRPTVAQMRGFDFARRSGLGIVAGAVSGCRECWDFDGDDVFRGFVEAVTACGLGEVLERIMTGYLDVTPSGGRRIIVGFPSTVIWQDVTLAKRLKRPEEMTHAKDKFKTLIELPTFAIIAPSNGATHPTGKAYQRIAGGCASIASYTAEERQALIDVARSFDEMPRREAMRPAGRLAPESTRPGDDYNRRMTWPALLEPAGWIHLYDRGDTAYWRRPGKTHGQSATTNFGSSDLFYPFSSSTEFESERSYSKFGVYTVLEHQGDFEQAAQALALQGYGTPRAAVRTEHQRPPAPAAATAAAWRWLADIPRAYVDWLWPTRLARSTLALWIGDGGLGKSRASNDLAARVTVGSPWPDGGLAPLGTVIVLSAEDDAASTIRPAIEAAGGDPTRVAVLEAVKEASGAERTFNLSTDLAALETVVTTTGASLLIVDPLSAYFGTSLDSYRDTDVRSVLEPVCRLAQRHRIAILGIMHIGKNSDRQARHRALGSVAFVNAARLVFAIGTDPDDPKRRLLVPVKANLCREAATLAFHLEDAGGVARAVWEAAPVADMSADVILNGRSVVDDGEQRNATDLLRQLLDDDDEIWPMAAKSVAAAGQAHGVHVRSLQRAAHKLGVEIKKSSFRSGWFWFRPRHEHDTSSPGSGAAESFAMKATVKTTEDVSVSNLSSSVDLSSSGAAKTTLSSSSSSLNIQQNIPTREDDTSMSTRARVAEGNQDALPTCLAELAAEADSDPIGREPDEPQHRGFPPEREQKRIP